MAILFFILLILLIFFLSQKVTRTLSRLFVRIFHSHTVAIHLLSFLFLPGIILHEFSHLLLANLLFVKTGEVEFFPEIHGNKVKMGSVAIAKTDPFRRFLIGIAPIAGGLGVMLALGSFLSGALFSWQSIVLLYGIFEIANTMFSSSKDMEGALGLGIGILFSLIILQVFGIRVLETIILFSQNQEVDALFSRLNIFLLISLGLNIFLLLLFQGISRFTTHYPH